MKKPSGKPKKAAMLEMKETMPLMPKKKAAKKAKKGMC